MIDDDSDRQREDSDPDHKPFLYEPVLAESIYT